MSYSIEWSDEAETTYIKILLYLEEKWTIQEVRNFMTRTGEVLNFIDKNPGIYPHSEKQNIHRAVVITRLASFMKYMSEKLYCSAFLIIARILISRSSDCVIKVQITASSYFYRNFES